MGKLANFLKDIEGELLDEGDDAITDLESISLAIESELEPGSKLSELDGGALQGCTPKLQALYRALENAQEHWDLYSAIAYHGLGSIFYNWTGDELDRVRAVLASFDSPLSPLLARAYELTVPAYEIIPETNWVTRNPGSDPYEILDESVQKELELLEAAMGEMQDESYGLALEACRAAAR